LKTIEGDLTIRNKKFALVAGRFFHLRVAMWAHMGPYGPVWTRIRFHIVFI